MNRGLKCVVLTALVGLAGCGVNQSLIETFARGLIETWCQNAAATTSLPTGVPADLAVVQADPATFSPASHPLANVVVGTTLDDLSALAGCWGRYTRQTIEDSQSGQDAVAEEFAVLQFDLERGTVTLHRYFTVPSADTDGSMGRASQLLGDAVSFELPIFLTEVYAITSTTDNLLMLEGVSAEGAAIGQDGLPVFSCLAALSSDVSATSTLRMLLTLQGDFLKEYDGTVEFNGTTSAEDLIPAEVDEFADLWVRFDCSAK